MTLLKCGQEKLHRTVTKKDKEDVIQDYCHEGQDWCSSGEG